MPSESSSWTNVTNNWENSTERYTNKSEVLGGLKSMSTAHKFVWDLVNVSALKMRCKAVYFQI